MRLNGAYPERFSPDSLLVPHRSLFFAVCYFHCSPRMCVCAKHVRAWMICWMKERRREKKKCRISTRIFSTPKAASKTIYIYIERSTRNKKAAKLFSFQIDNKLLNDIKGKISKPYRHYDHKNLFIVFLRVQNFTRFHQFGFGSLPTLALSCVLRHRKENERMNE